MLIEKYNIYLMKYKQSIMISYNNNNYKKIRIKNFK